MPTNTPFVIRIELKSPIIPGYRLMLDGILSGILFARLGDPVRALSEIPLTRVGRIFRGSQALLEGPAAAVPVTYTSALRAERDLSPESVRPEGRRGYQRIEVARGPFQNRMTEMLSYEAKAVWFSGQGDVDAISSLIEDVPAIGTKRSSGFGAIRSYDIEEVSTKQPGIMFADGSPARCVPVDTWAMAGGTSDVLLASENATPPYWQSNHETCVVPSRLVVARKDAENLLGIC